MTSFQSRVLTGLALAAAALVGACAQDAPPAYENADLVLAHAQVIDPETRTVTETHLVLGEGRILAWTDRLPDAEAVEIIDVQGRWVMPSFVDTHTHSFGNRGPMAPSDNPGTAAIAERVLLAGVTAFLDLFGDEETLIEVRSQQRAGEIGGADIYASLSCLTAPNGHCTEYGIPTRTFETPDQARAVVDDLARHAPDVIKLIYQPSDDQPSIDLDTFQAAIQAAHSHGLTTIAHIKTWQETLEAARAGVTVFTHIPHGPIPEGVAEQLAQTGVIAIPTLTVHIDLTRYLFDETVLAAPLAHAVTTPAIIESYSNQETVARFAPQEARWRAMDQMRLQSVRQLHQAGVPMLVGTDGGNWGVLQGYSVHREMLLLEEAGLPRWDILAAATTRAGAFLNADYGVQPGDLANLVVLDASPLDSIANTQSIVHVLHNGQRVRRSESPAR